MSICELYVKRLTIVGEILAGLLRTGKKPIEKPIGSISFH
jgi:hypothetical protein